MRERRDEGERVKGRNECECVWMEESVCDWEKKKREGERRLREGSSGNIDTNERRKIVFD